MTNVHVIDGHPCVMSQVGEIGNYYGNLFVVERLGRFYWAIDNHDRDFGDLREWEEISLMLYLALMDHNANLKTSTD